VGAVCDGHACRRIVSLVNTVVVPAKLTAPFRPAPGFGPVGSPGSSSRSRLTPGAGHSRQCADLKDKVTVYLFEPTGNVARWGVGVGRRQGLDARRAPGQRGKDLVSGCLRGGVDRVATSGAQVDLEAAIPSVSLGARIPGAPATVRNGSEAALGLGVRAEAAGRAQRDTDIIGHGAQPVVLPARPPVWPRAWWLDVELPRDLWNSLTDFV